MSAPVVMDYGMEAISGPWLFVIMFLMGAGLYVYGVITNRTLVVVLGLIFLVGGFLFLLLEHQSEWIAGHDLPAD